MMRWLAKLPGMSEEQREQATRLESDPEIVSFLLSEGIADKREILRAKSRFYRLPCLTLDGYYPSNEATELLTEEQARKLRTMPLFLNDGVLYTAMADPNDLRCEDFIRKLTGRRVKPVLADLEDIRKAITRKYLATGEEPKAPPKPRAAPSKSRAQQQEELNENQSPVVKTVWQVINRAIRLGASDLHLEPERERVSLRYRIDGILHPFPAPDLDEYSAVVSRIKIISQLDIAEKRLPQDGRVSVNLEGREYDLRISILPNVHGEGICIRVLDPKAADRELEEMGFQPELLKRYEKVIRRPHGIVLVTGPTGSGKSTTLYATLSRIASSEKKIITVEDPVEYKLQGLQQVPIRPEIGYTFGVGLRAILRHDPDIIMLGEIRDIESAQIAFRAALTGHLLFSTLHTNSAALAVSRLVDMGLPPYQVMAGLSGVLAQRLLRLLCESCKRETELSAETARELGLDPSHRRPRVFEPVGCKKCNNLGYKGRTAIHELLRITPAMKQLREQDINEPNLVALARQDGFTSLRESALEKLFAGQTSVSEVLSLTAD